MKTKEGGQVLVGVILLMLVMLIMVPAMVTWVQQEAKLSVKEKRSSLAYNLAEAAVERGYWKVKSSTGYVNMALNGQAISGYEFDDTFTDIAGGSYRIQISSVSPKSVVIIGEGRDPSSNEVRAIHAVFQNETLYSPLLSQGDVSYQQGLGIYWGPIMSQGNITLQTDAVANLYFPRKFAKGTVIGTANNPRDLNGPLPPNTDNSEWWSMYPYIPELPILDFAALRSSAAATNTLNVYGCKGNGTYTANGVTEKAWDKQSSCPGGSPHTNHFGNPWSHPKSPQWPTVATSTNQYVWYWDGDLVLTGSWCGNSACGNSTGLWGDLIVRGNLTIDTPGEYNYTGHVPANAYMEHHRLLKTTDDTATKGEYPADIGLSSAAANWSFGTDQWCQPGTGCTAPNGGWINTVGMRGFTYVGGNLTIENFMDFNGAVWVNGNVSAFNGTNTAFCGIFFDDSLEVPTLNVILVRQSWEEVAPSKTAWAAE